MADDRFADLNYERFRQLAEDDSLDPIEKVGFPVSYRAGKEHLVFEDIVRKLSNLTREAQVVVDIGSGCSGIARSLIELCGNRRHTLILSDSPEMLRHLPNEPFIVKAPGRYPTECPSVFERYTVGVDAVLAYSVLQYVAVEGDMLEFVGRSLDLLRAGGQMLIGDIPNRSKRRRFFRSEAGVRFHQAFTGTASAPPEDDGAGPSLDDDRVVALVKFVRDRGCDAYIVPQPPQLPMANRREDILIVRP